MNISEHISHFEQEMIRRNYSKQTVEIYSSCLKKFFGDSKKDHPKNINESDIREFLSEFKEPNTQRSYHSAIKKFYDVCIGQKDKFKYIPYCRKDKKLPIVLSVDEIQKMFNVCQNTKHKTMLAFLYSCGLRVSELINLKLEHIDRSRMIINVIQAKGNKDRQVMLPPAILPLFDKYYNEYLPKEYVFNGWKNEPQYSERSVGEVIKQLASKAVITKRVYTHLIRHCSFTHMVESGTDINLIQKIAGHSSVKTTNLYLHISDNHISKIQSPLEGIML
jgi:integrase/recombinase XerD